MDIFSLEGHYHYASRTHDDPVGQALGHQTDLLVESPQRFVCMKNNISARFLDALQHGAARGMLVTAITVGYA